tara:strand:+ start:7731 stop:8759 length:1029 start_codon:yes stop_codon:yes gene_type:complete
LFAAEPGPAAVVYGCAGLKLTADEKALFRDCKPAGYILFDRNLDTPEQVMRLTESLRVVSGNEEILIMIDQEGGRVQRLHPPHWSEYPPMRMFGDYSRDNANEAAACVALNYRLIASELTPLGINVNCAPVLDIPIAGSHEIIGDRAFSNNPSIVAILGRSACDGLLQGGILPVIKHIPGHGRALVDSHKEVPKVDAPLVNLRLTDFVPFSGLSDAPAGMTAHVIYSSVDSEQPGSTSPVLIEEIIRNEIGFNGLLFSDDVCMEGLSGRPEQRVHSVLAAGCDIAIHCDGNFMNMLAIAENCPQMRKESLARLNSARQRVFDSDDFDAEAAKWRISAFLGQL